MFYTRSTHEILNNPWGEITPNSATSNQIPPGWSLLRPLTINDIVMWEEIFYEPGIIGIYAAWSPFEDFYIIVHNLFLKDKESIEQFYGKHSLSDLLNRLQEFNIDITVKKVWIS